MSKQAVTTALLNIVRFITVGPRGFSTVVEKNIDTLVEVFGLNEEELSEGAIKADYFRDHFDEFIATTKSKYLKADYSAATNLDECIIYSGGKAIDGYASHRVRKSVFEFFSDHYARTAEGYEFDHACCVPGQCDGGPLCPHRACVNASHLHEIKKEVNVSTNNNRKVAPVGQRKVRASRSRCKNRHRMTPENTNPSGECRACNAINQENWRVRTLIRKAERKAALDPSILKKSEKIKFTAKPRVLGEVEDYVDDLELFPIF